MQNSTAPAIITVVPEENAQIVDTPAPVPVRVPVTTPAAVPMVGGRALSKQEEQIILEIRGVRERSKGRPCMIVVRFDGGMQIFESMPVCRRF